MHMVSRQVLRWLGRREWIPFGVRDRVIRHFADPNLQTPNPYEVEFFGMRYRGDLSNFIDWSVYFYGAYEKANLALLRDLARDGRLSLVLVGTPPPTTGECRFLAATVLARPLQPAKLRALIKHLLDDAEALTID